MPGIGVGKTDGNKETIALITENYLGLMRIGNNKPPVRLSEDMKDNPYAQRAYLLEVIAYARAVGIHSKRNDG